MRSCAANAQPESARVARYLLFGTELYALPILRPLAAAIAQRGDEARWFVHGFDASPYLRADEPQCASVREVMRFQPDAVLCASNWVPDFFPGLKVQVFHGFNVEKRDAARGHFRVRGLFDLYCTQGPATTAPFQQLQATDPHFRVAETGWPKLDPLFAAEDAQADAWRAMAQGRPVLLYGATFTERLSSAPHLHEKIARLIASGKYYWLLTLHPKCPPEWFARYRALAGPHACFVESDRLISLLRAADVLVSDTSSIVSEFVVQHKPVVTWRNRAPKPHMIDIDCVDALAPAIETALAPTPTLRAALRDYASSIHPNRDGRASERVLDAVAAFARAGLAHKPSNLWRRLQMRIKLGWFGRATQN
jgi:CDP-glycerol glycerophosphotransferase (TagB/SpsB family)